MYMPSLLLLSSVCSVLNSGFMSAYLKMTGKAVLHHHQSPHSLHLHKGMSSFYTISLQVTFRLQVVMVSMYAFCRSKASASELIEAHWQRVLPSNNEVRVRLVIWRKLFLEDALHKMRSGLDLTKHLRVTFVGEPTVDAGGPLRELFHLLLMSMAQNNRLFCGALTARIPNHNITELQRRTYFYVGVFLYPL